MAWTLIHAAWLHYLLAIINAHDWTTRYVTTFTTEIFSILNSIIYFHKAIQELERAHGALTFAAFLNAVIGAIGTMLLAIFLSTAESWKPLFHRNVRIGLSEYAAAISIIIFIGLPHVGELANLDRMTSSYQHVIQAVLSRPILVCCGILGATKLGGRLLLSFRESLSPSFSFLIMR